jgi:hypothetical protein
MVGVIRPENPVMHQRVPFIRKPEPPEGAVHDITVQGPLKERAENGSGDRPDGAPKKKHGHNDFVFGKLLKKGVSGHGLPA